ncbi:3-deoxy-D-manno-octulosonic acid transferase [Daejeonella sp.]|jgi:3-deoxy-D-manno-octulosonic-acid transferase|uniref:3-deoxy-D-manno-octulosonic acid transferase n=1 Tax=Daejeonella sp. TaxID=2805397 RepID=UPI0037C07566
MLFLYDAGICLYTLLIAIFSLKNKKAQFWIQGRKGLFERIEKSLEKNKKYAWFHFASLGEFEQGRPVLEKLKSDHPNTPIVITFFSPSGYEVRKNYPLADHVFYLPIDTKQNARKLVRLLNPTIAVFTKYEYWYHYFEALNANKTPLYIISGIFRKEQAFFKWYGGLHRKMLGLVSHFFVQNEESRHLLAEIGVKNVSVSGDTRFDRVDFNAKNPIKISQVEEFCKNNHSFIAGSTWLEDEQLIETLIEVMPDWKFIIAPHEVNENRIKNIEKLFPNSIRFSEIQEGGISPQTIAASQVLIIDSIGILSSIYQYGEIAYIGGGFGVGIHNTLEAAAFGLPVIFGPNYARFKEAVELIKKSAAFSIKDSQELKTDVNFLLKEENRIKSGQTALGYVQSQTGATQKFLDFIYSKGTF